jgi:hypothetical protein
MLHIDDHEVHSGLPKKLHDVRGPHIDKRTHNYVSLRQPRY